MLFHLFYRDLQSTYKGVGLVIIWLVVSKIFYFHPYLGKIPILTNIFQMCWNHQLVIQLQSTIKIQAKQPFSGLKCSFSGELFDASCEVSKGSTQHSRGQSLDFGPKVLLR